MWLLIQGTRQGVVRWRAAILLAVPATLLFPVAPLLSVGLMLKNYRTDVPLETFQAMSYVIVVMGAVFGFLLMGAAAALVVTFYPDAVRALRRGNRAAMAWDAVAAVMAAAGIALVLHQFQGQLVSQFHAQAVLSVGSPDIIASAAPPWRHWPPPSAPCLPMPRCSAWSHSGLAIDPALDALCRLAARLVRFLPNDVRTPGEFLLHYVISLTTAAAGIAFCWFFARRNYLAYALVLWLMACARR
jgi:hypothetical protein